MGADASGGAEPEGGATESGVSAGRGDARYERRMAAESAASTPAIGECGGTRLLPSREGAEKKAGSNPPLVWLAGEWKGVVLNYLKHYYFHFVYDVANRDSIWKEVEAANVARRPKWPRTTM